MSRQQTQQRPIFCSLLCSVSAPCVYLPPLKSAVSQMPCHFGAVKHLVSLHPQAHQRTRSRLQQHSLGRQEWQSPHRRRRRSVKLYTAHPLRSPRTFILASVSDQRFTRLRYGSDNSNLTASSLQHIPTLVLPRIARCCLRQRRRNLCPSLHSSFSPRRMQPHR